MTVTYEVSVRQPIHPDPEVAARFVEVALSNCEFGCKIYADPRSDVRVVAHSFIYGCRK